MTDIRTRLIDAICAAEFRPRETVEAIVDVVLSLPGMAIVELPDGREHAAEDWSVRPMRSDPSLIAVRLEPPLFPDGARALAAALLAAANAAEVDA